MPIVVICADVLMEETYILFHHTL